LRRWQSTEIVREGLRKAGVVAAIETRKPFDVVILDYFRCAEIIGGCFRQANGIALSADIVRPSSFSCGFIKRR
jgi:hypothetical protein